MAKQPKTGAAIVPIRRRQAGAPRALVFLDGSPDGDLHAQQTIVRTLKEYKVPVGALLRTLKNMESRRLLVMERRAAERDRLYKKAGRVFVLLQQALVLVPPDTDLEDLTLAALTEAESVCLARGAVARHARRRRELQARGEGPGRTRIASGARLAAVQQRFMPEVRRLVATAIGRALRQQRAVHDRARQVFEVRIGTRAYVERDDLAANDLAAQFIRAFFPSWGATTTPELVRKARKSSRR